MTGIYPRHVHKYGCQCFASKHFWASNLHMEGGSTDTALERIEAAIARIEQAALRRNESTAQLRFRHEKLKTAVSESLGELDAVIAGQRP